MTEDYWTGSMQKAEGNAGGLTVSWVSGWMWKMEDGGSGLQRVESKYQARFSLKSLGTGTGVNCAPLFVPTSVFPSTFAKLRCNNPVPTLAPRRPSVGLMPVPYPQQWILLGSMRMFRPKSRRMPHRLSTTTTVMNHRRHLQSANWRKMKYPETVEERVRNEIWAVATTCTQIPFSLS